MIFDKNSNGAAELRLVTGSYYANNEFGKIKGIVEQVQDETAEIIGASTMTALEALYLAGNDDNHCVMWAQKVIGTMATLRLYRSNDLSHEDDGRKFKIDDANEKIPWEWQLNRDDRIIMESYYDALNSLLHNLENSGIAAYKETESYRMKQVLLVCSAKQLFYFGGIKEDYYLYHTMIPYLMEAQREVKKEYGDSFAQLVTGNAGGEIQFANEVIYAASFAESLLAMSIMLRRQRLTMIPYGIVKSVRKEGGMEETSPTEKEMKDYGETLHKDACYWINEMKKLRDIAASAELYKRTVADKNDPHNKYFRL